MLDNKGWEQKLRKAKESKELGFCQLPSESGIKIHGDRDSVTITMTEVGVCANMQTDAAAFEVWALALLFHCGVQKVEIALDKGPKAPANEDPHFQRFLYRLTNLHALFPELVVADPELLERSVASGKLYELFLNQPNGHRTPTSGAEVDARLRAVANQAGCSESSLEIALEVSPAFRRALGFDKIMRQWPVGLFRDEVTGKNRIFTGRKSAIDLIGIRSDELLLFELKKKGNRKAGALSELFFYSCLMRDALLGRFKFEEKRRNDAVGRDDIKACTRIAAILLAPGMHPLIEEPTIISQLNAAMAGRWSDFPVIFRTLHLGVPEKPGEDFTFG